MKRRKSKRVSYGESFRAESGHKHRGKNLFPSSLPIRDATAKNGSAATGNGGVPIAGVPVEPQCAAGFIASVLDLWFIFEKQQQRNGGKNKHT